MKLVRWGDIGDERPGLIDADGQVRDLNEHAADIAGDALAPEALARFAAIDPQSLPLVPAGARLGPCVGNVGKFICVGLNYADHAAETGAEVPVEPILFLKATSAIAGPYDDVHLPRGSTKSDWEVELGVVIGTVASYVDEASALDHVAGFCIINDLSERAFQLEGTGQWTKGKGCDGFGPLGPWLVTPDEIPVLDDLNLWLDLNGQRMQDGSTRTMVFGVAFLVSYISKFMTLDPGDVISTGTPPGVGLGRKPPRFLAVGDEMRLGIAGLGEQRQRVLSSR
jgi:2-keto-4-pentenoate hydratase/2-oxohepta-3-ene-1,7-dioic acid hydratase in catechol pathway